MSTEPTPAGPPQSHPMRRFLNFWFAPADPTTLGFIRIIAGCLLLYTHWAYTPDLVNFFGKDAWYNLETINRERREMPNVSPSLEWEHPAFPDRGAQIPEPPARKAACMDYLRSLAGPEADVTKLEPKIAYLSRAVAADEERRKKLFAPGGAAADALDYLAKLANGERDRADQLAVLADESLREVKAAERKPPLPIPPTPAIASGQTPETRKQIARDARAFADALPAAQPARGFVFDYLFQMDHAQRDAMLKWVRRVAQLPSEQRAAECDYMAYWNVDKAIVEQFGTPIFSLFYHITDPTLMRVVHGATFVVFLLFTLGVSTRLMSVLTWLGALSYLHRSMHILFGMDTMMNIALFYLMIGDSGAALSVDRLVKRYRAARQSLAKSGKIDEPTRLYLAAPPASVTAGFALRLLQVHFCFIYMASGLSKLKGNSWWNANAYWDTLANPEFTPIFYKTYESGLRWIMQNRMIYGVMCALSVAYTFICEIGVPFLVWTRLRPVAVMMGVMLHAGIALFMGLVVFSLFMLTLLLCYIPGVAIRSVLFGTPSDQDKLRVRYDASSTGQRRAAALVAMLDFDGRVELAAGADSPSLVAETADGPVSGARFPRVLSERVPTLKFLRFALSIPAIGRAFTGAAAKPTPRLQLQKRV